MMQYRLSQRGVSLVELLIAIAVILLIAGFLAIGFQNFARFQEFNLALSDITFHIEQAHTDARSAVDDTSHGVQFGTTSITRFTGDTYNALNPFNETTYYQTVSVSPSLTGGVDVVVFSKLTGRPNATGTILVTGANYSGSEIITISDSGIIE